MAAGGALIPTTVSPPNTVVESEFPRLAPVGVSVVSVVSECTARLGRPQGEPGNLSGDAVLHTNEDLPLAAAVVLRSWPG